jgi:putative transposase
MQLVEQHLIRKTDPCYASIDAAAFASKNLYNQATYQIRQAFLQEGKYLPYAEIFHRIKHMDCYKALPAKVANSILILIHKNWMAFFKARESYREDPSKFQARPRIPGYKDKEKGRNILIYDTQALGKRHFKKTGKLLPSGLPIEIETQISRWEDIDQVRIVPRGSSYVIEVVYLAEEHPAPVDPRCIAALDVGVDQLAALTSNKPGFVPRLINGRPLKDCNHYYNQQRAHSQKRLAKQNRFSSRRLDQITAKRTRRVNHYLHTASRTIIDLLASEGIGVLVIGLNCQWKQEVTLGKRNNQQFVQLPHSRFIDMLTYKAHRVGIRVIVREESYTSQASFLDGDAIPTYDPTRKERLTFSGRRVERGLYRAKNGRRIHADVNGSYNTLRKEFPDAFHAFSDSQARPGQEIGALQLRLAAWRRNVGRIQVPSSPLAV